MKSSNLHRRKMLFNSVLSEKLTLCKYPVVASYTFDSPSQIFSSRIKSGKIFINVNLNFEKSPLFEKEENAEDTELFFRAYFINAYVRLLENAKNRIPESYFSGLAVLNAAESLEGNKTKRAFMPCVSKRVKNQRPIDVSCTVRALTGMQIEFSEAISPETAKRWDKLLSELISYTAVPEIEYRKSSEPDFAIASALHSAARLLENQREAAKSYGIFGDFGITCEKDITPESIFENAKAAENPFWSGAAARLLLLSPLSKREEALLRSDSLKEILSAMQNDAFEYYAECKESKNPLVMDNLAALKILSRLTDEKASVNECLIKKGRIHSYG